jgi:hypothetical protein
MNPGKKVLEALGLSNQSNEPSSKGGPKIKKTKTVKTEVQRLIPGKRGKRSKQETESVIWICALAESAPVPRLDSIPPVISLPRVPEQVRPAVTTPPPEMVQQLRRMGTPPAPVPPPSPEEDEPEPIDPKLLKIARMLDRVKIQHRFSGDQSNGASAPRVEEDPPILVTTTTTPYPLIHVKSDLDPELVMWLEVESRKYLKLANQPKSHGPWACRLAQVSCGFDVMARGKAWVRDYFKHASGAVFGLLDAARDHKDLDQLSGLMEHIVYLDMLAEIADFHPQKGRVSSNLESYREDRFIDLPYT